MATNKTCLQSTIPARSDTLQSQSRNVPISCDCTGVNIVPVSCYVQLVGIKKAKQKV